MIELLETGEVEELVKYTADNLNNFLTRESDRELMSNVVERLKNISNENEKK